MFGFLLDIYPKEEILDHSRETVSAEIVLFLPPHCLHVKVVMGF